jgi:hypothetical protein
VKENEEKGKRLAGAMLFRRPLFFEALNEMNQGRVAPTPTAPSRVTFGTVRGFSPCARKTGVFSLHECVGNGRKMGQKTRRRIRSTRLKRIIAAINQKKFGPYADPKVGGVPIDFLTDLDHHRRQSGSPTLNAKGEFTGIVF